MWVKILNNYEISDAGIIRNAKTGRVIKQFVGKDGYVRTQIAGKTRLVHRMVAMAFIPKDENKPFVNHKDGNKQNNNLNNLEWCTFSENLKHAYRHNLKTSLGENNGRSKLSNSDIEYIKSYYIPRHSTYGAKAMAKKFGVAHQTICAVVSGQNWGKT